MLAYSSVSLSPPQLRFIAAYMMYGKRSKAVRLAYPEESKQWSNKYISLKGSRLMENDGVKAEIINRSAIMEQNANLGAQRIQKIIQDGKEHNALTASMFAVEQIDGKAKQMLKVESKHVSVTYDLSGGQAGEVPAHILKQLEED